MKIARSIFGGLIILSAPIYWHFLGLPAEGAVLMAAVGFFIIPGADEKDER